MLFDLMDTVVREYYGITQEQLLLLDSGGLLTDEELHKVVMEAMNTPPSSSSTPNKELVNQKLNK